MLPHHCSHPLIVYVVLVTAVTKALTGVADMACGGSSGATSSATSARKRLRGDLLCQYDTLVQPQPVVNVSIELFVRRAKVVHQTLNMQVLMNVQWTDRFLQWDPAKYDDVKEIHLSSDEIWSPPVATISTLPWFRGDDEPEYGGEGGMWPAVCSVARNGTVVCPTALAMGGSCAVSHLHWPHVEASCAAYVGTDFRTDKNVTYHFHSDSAQVELAYYNPDNDWLVTDVRRGDVDVVLDQEDADVKALAYQFKLRARGAVILTALAGPAVVLSLLTLVSFFLPADSYARVALCCCSLFGTVLASSLLFETLPPHGGPNPVIVTFYSGLLVLSAIAIFVPLLLNAIVPGRKKGPVAPRWLYSFHSWLNNSVIGKILLRVLLMAPLQSVCQAIELMPALYMQKGGLPVEAEREENQSGPQISQTGATSDPHHDLGPQHIWNFTSTFLNRSMFYVFLIISGTLCLYLIHSVAIYEDIDIGWVE